MVGLMVESAQTLLTTWDSRIEAEGGQMAEITVDEDLRSLSADVISRACFGSSYVKGKEVFSKLRSLQNIMSRQSFLFGNNLFGYVPTDRPFCYIFQHLKRQLYANVFSQISSVEGWEGSEESRKGNRVANMEGDPRTPK